MARTAPSAAELFLSGIPVLDFSRISWLSVGKHFPTPPALPFTEVCADPASLTNKTCAFCRTHSSVWFTVCYLQVLSLVMWGAAELFVTGVTSAWQHRIADLCQDTEHKLLLQSPTPECQPCSFLERSLSCQSCAVELGPSWRTRGSWFQLPPVQ